MGWQESCEVQQRNAKSCTRRGIKFVVIQAGDHLESSFAEEALGILTFNSLNMSHQCTLAAEKVGVHWEKPCQRVKGGDPPSLLSPGETRLEC